MASAHHPFPTVSIGIPFLSWDAYTAAAVQSVLNQTVEEWQLILLFDGSQNSVPNLSSAIRSDPRISVHSNSRQMGLSHSLNRIAHLASGEFLFRMDADDVMHPDRVAVTMQHLSQGQIDVLGTHAYAIDDDGRLLGAYREGPLPTTQRGFLRSNALSHPTVAGRTAWFKENPYDETIRRAEDKELWLRTHATARMAKISERTLFYRLPSTPDARKVRATHKDNLRLLQSYAELRTVDRARELSRATAKHQAQSTMLRAGLGGRIQARKVLPLAAEDREAAEIALARATRGVSQ